MTVLRPYPWILVVSLAMLSPAAAGVGGASPWVSTEQSQVRLVSAASATDGDAALSLGIQVRLEPGWKIYWRSPGDTGIPPQFDWSGSRNLAEVRVDWPAPRRFNLFGFETFGYTDEVVLPVVARLKDRASPASIRLALSYAICKDVCIPLDAGLALDLPAAAATTTPFTTLIARFAARVPGASGSGGLAIDSVAAKDGASTPLLVIEASAREPFRTPDVLVEGPAPLSFAKPDRQLAPDGRGAVLTVAVRGVSRAAELGGRSFTVTLIDGERAVEKELTVAKTR